MISHKHADRRPAAPSTDTGNPGDGVRARRRGQFGLAVALGVSAAVMAGCAADSRQPPRPAQTPATPTTDAQVIWNPYDHLPKVPSFRLTSTDVRDGEPMPRAQRSGVLGNRDGQDLSPHLSWSRFPKDTKSFAVTVYDADAATGSGFWHWAVADLPASTTSLPTGAGAEHSTRLPKGAYQLPNDARMTRYLGAAPPAGSGRHHYYIVVYALDVKSVKPLGVDNDSTPALLGANLSSHTLARAVIVPWAKARTDSE
ncbi:YbhB/YbcL family Raf kinase inhibitor-like protein [Streptomyces iranensis]|uniref:YbhB/YbcL family Raf kinase inhibitor-like protein n=1 Tax=Streptomyces iranensis TaxID=576784 RepID=UPI0039B78D2C